MKQIPKDERPYEKCVRLGAQSLTDAELLAVLLRTGTVGSPSVHMAEEILSLSKDRKGLLGLHTLSLAQLKSVKGIGTVKAIQIKCIGELSKRIAQTNSQERASVYPARNHCGLLHGAAAPQGNRRSLSV